MPTSDRRAPLHPYQSVNLKPLAV